MIKLLDFLCTLSSEMAITLTNTNVSPVVPLPVRKGASAKNNVIELTPPTYLDSVHTIILYSLV